MAEADAIKAKASRGRRYGIRSRGHMDIGRAVIEMVMNAMPEKQTVAQPFQG